MAFCICGCGLQTKMATRTSTRDKYKKGEYRKYRSGHNSRVLHPLKGKPGWNKGKKLTDEHKQRISAANKGQKRTEEARFKMSVACRGKIPWNKGKTLSEEYRKKLSEAHKGQKLSIEHRESISKANTGRCFSEETRRKISISNTGKRHSLETKRLLSEISKKRIVSDETKRKLSEIGKGRRHTEEAKKKMSEKLKGKIFTAEHRKKISESQKGEKSHSWKGGISKVPYCFEFDKQFKEKIKERDDYVCQECGQAESALGYSLHIHHIDYDKKNNLPVNLISLCRKCHSKTNFNRVQWIPFLSNKIYAKVVHV